MHWTRMFWGATRVSTAAVAGAALLLILVGCSSTGSKGGCGGGCCRGRGSSGDSEVSPLSGGSAGPGDTVASKYGGQRTCPVTGEELGSMGKPIPVSVKGQTVYVCCEGCVAKFRQNPDTFLAKVQAERGAR